jgi:hypothetical protein
MNFANTYPPNLQLAKTEIITLCIFEAYKKTAMVHCLLPFLKWPLNKYMSQLRKTFA